MRKKDGPFTGEIRSLIKAFTKEGFSTVAVDNGGGPVRTTTVGEAVNEADACDEAHIFIQHPKGRDRNGVPGKTLWIYLVLGNEHGELCSDYCIDPDFDRIIKAESDKWEGRKVNYSR